MKNITVVLAAAAVAFAGAAFADKGGKGKDKDKGHESHHADSAPGKSAGKGKGGGKKFGSGERDHVAAYFAAHPAERDQLPPGLAKQGKIPPGWEKKVRVGQRIPDDVWVLHVPLPPAVVVKLPPPPPGVVHVRIQHRVVSVHEHTREVFDSFDLR